MPPDRPLSESDIRLVETWILNGAREHEGDLPPPIDGSLTDGPPSDAGLLDGPADAPTGDAASDGATDAPADAPVSDATTGG